MRATPYPAAGHGGEPVRRPRGATRIVGGVLRVRLERAVVGGLACLVFATLAPGCGGEASAPAGSWQAPVEISAPAEQTSDRQVGIDADGNAVAVWLTDSDGNNTSKSAVYAARRPAGGRWGAPVRVSAADGVVSAVQITVDEGGNAMVVWQRSFPPREVSFVESAARPAGGTWQRPEQVSKAGSGSTGPHVAIDGQGDAVAVWQRTSAGRTQVQSAVRSAGGRWVQPRTSRGCQWPATVSPCRASRPTHAATRSLSGRTSTSATWASFRAPCARSAGVGRPRSRSRRPVADRSRPTWRSVLRARRPPCGWTTPTR